MNSLASHHAESHRVHLLVPDVRCAGCCLSIEKALGDMAGIRQLSVSFAEKRLSFVADDLQAKARVAEKLATMGYPSSPDLGGEELELYKNERRQLLARLGVAGIGMMQVMMFAFTDYLAGTEGIDAAYDTLMRWAAMVVAVPVTLYSAMPFHRGALRDLKNRAPGMDVPVSIAILSAFTLSVFHTLSGVGDVYFDSACMFTFFLLLGRYLELSARQSFHVERTLGEHLLPEFARLEDGTLLKPTELAVGQMLVINLGESVPADCIVQSGSAHVDESAFTGEPEFKRKETGSLLLAGSRLSQGHVVARVSGPRQDWVITHLSEAFRQAAAFKPAFAVMADRIAKYFVSLVLTLAALTAIYWWSQGNQNFYAIALSVLVVSCPCALSLATPVAYTIATGAVRQLGVLVDKGAFLETLDSVNTIVFDKTGTLTEGRMELAEVVVVEQSMSRQDMINLAASVEQESLHPVAMSLKEVATELVTVKAIKTVPGQGVSAEVDGTIFWIGRPSGLDREVQRPDQQANWVVLARDNEVLGWFRFADRLRDGVGEMIQTLRHEGKKVLVYSGDGSETGRSQVGTLQVDGSCLGVTPEEKIEGVRQLQSQGNRVLMVGDGLNDAGALAVADISLAVNPVDVVVQSAADATLVRPDLSNFTSLFGYASRVSRIIRQNLVWALMYNLSVIPLAIAGFVPPWVAALGMSLSSLLVTLNAGRLVRTS